MTERWKLGNYEFTINPNEYSEQVQMVGDTAVTLDGTVISQPTSTMEEYAFSSIMFQNRPRIISVVSMPNLGGVEYANNKYYILNNSTKKVDVYTSNLATLSKSIDLVTSVTNENFTSFDVLSDETIYAVNSQSSSDILHIVTATTKTAKTFSGLTGKVSGIKYDNGTIWVVTDSYMLYGLDSNLVILKSLSLPYINPLKLGYKGMTIINGYLVISFNGDDTVGAYHIDLSNGNIVNSFSLPDYAIVSDVAFDGINFIFSTTTGNQLIYSNGNTLLQDVYVLEKEIKTKGYISMIDDMEVERKVAVSKYNIERLEGSLQKYNVSISVTKINRGVN